MEHLNWISIETAEPPETDEYIVACGEAVTAGWYDKDENEWITNYERILDDVTHWMAFPAAPARQEQKQ